MDRHALARALRDAAVPEGHYWIEGVHEPAPPPPDFLYLRRVADGLWETGVYERGTREPIATHATETAACAHLLTLLT